ncbi:terminase large subunit [Clostridium gasigenes]|uniref:terminase large subunit n=1 Tax=Clostridium gasigenes TaxID=94869 RepID=UPI0014382FFF|nr:terminase TerL endonuclease subunit [Clostridium gasigenes]NKF05295.1 terminase large subunit [Clostridium gasigenes]QSW18750.1 terminase large subunit [Clostridium gasigenes]
MFLLDNAIQYAEDVVAGKEITTKEIIIQCKWFLIDYKKRQYEEDFQFYFDEEKLSIINNLLKLFNFATGFVEGKQVLENLAPFQCFAIANIFGWRYKNNIVKFRYNDITLYMARKNAKTALVGIIFLLLLITEQKYSEFYSICLSKELAAEIKKSMEQIINVSPLVNKHFKVSTTKTGMITCLLTNSFFQPRTAEAGKNNSIRPSAYVSDEHGNFKDNSNFTAMKSGQKNVINPLVFRTTTAYAIDNSIMIDDLDYIKKVFSRAIKNERQFALLYYADEENLWNDDGMYQANPLRIEENYTTIKEDRERAEVQDNLKEEYLTKAMNYFLPANVGETYINSDAVAKCSTKEDLEFWRGKQVYLGVDMSQTDDLTAVSMVCLHEGFIHAKSWAFIPAESIEVKSKKDKVDYNIMIENGNAFYSGSAIIDYAFVENFVITLSKVYGVEIVQLGFDKRDALSSIQKYENAYVECVEVRQHSSVLFPPTKLLKESILSEKFKFDKNKLLEVHFMNCKCAYDTNKHYYVTKKKSTGKVDMVVSLIIATYLLQQKELEDDDEFTCESY